MGKHEGLFSLLKIMDIYEKNEFDVLIVDCAPTGETMALLKFPEMIGSWMNKIIPMKRKAVKVVGPTVEKVAKIPMPKDIMFDEVEQLMRRLEELQNLMSRKDVVSIRIVTTPEKIYGEINPIDVLFCDTIFKIEKTDEGYTMSIHLPFVDKRELDMLQKGEELTIIIKNERRSFILPEYLKSREISKAEYKENMLNLYFVKLSFV